MRAYLDLVRHILDHGERRDDRTGTGTLSMFGAQVRYDLREGFPLLTTKKVLFGAVVRELLWFLRGSTNIHDDLTQHTPIWDAWADERGELGPIYGHQWRSWGGAWGQPGPAGAGVEQAGAAGIDHNGQISAGVDHNGQNDAGVDHNGQISAGVDQIAAAIEMIRRDPTSRRIIVSAWNVAELGQMALPPCHLLFQLYVAGRHLDLQLYQRSADMALGVPFNIASYALLLTLIARECDLTPRYFVHTFGDAHVYLNHVDGLREQLSRSPLPLPTVRVADVPLDDLQFEDIELVGYQHHPFIRFEVAV